MTDAKDMTCEHCRELLTDLVCGELNPRDEERARAHAADCAECKKSLASFQFAIWAASEVALEEPSPALDQRIMAAAEAALKQAPAAREPSQAMASFSAWLSKLGDFAMSPQVAMASVLLLVVGIGLYALPLGGPAPHAALAPPAEQDKSELPASELGTGSAVPISPVEQAEAKKAAGTAARAARARASRPATAAKPEAPHRDRVSSSAGSGPAADKIGESTGGLGSLGSAAGGGGRASENADDELARREPVAEPRPAPVELAERKKDALPAGAVEGPAAFPAAPAQEPSAQPEAPAKTEEKRAEVAPPADGAPPAREGAAADAAEAPGASAPAPSVDASASAPAAPKPPSERSELARGMQALSAGRLPQAVAILNPLARAGSDEVRDLAQALLAEALHDSGRCKEAIQWFARITARPSASARSLELAADCYAKTGNEAKATELRARARGR